MPWIEEEVGPFDPPARIDWRVSRYIHTGSKERACLEKFLADVSTGPVRAPCDHLGQVTLVRICNHIMHFGHNSSSTWINDIEPELSTP